MGIRTVGVGAYCRDITANLAASFRAIYDWIGFSDGRTARTVGHAASAGGRGNKEPRTAVPVRGVGRNGEP